MRVPDSAAGNNSHLGRLAGIGDVFHGYGLLGAAASFQVHVAHAHEFGGNGVHHAELGLVRRHGHGSADVFHRRALAAVDELVSRRDGFHVERTHERATAHLLVNQVVRVATAHESHEEHRVETGNHLRSSTREKNHGQIDRRLECRHLLGERKVPEVRATNEQKVGAVFGRHGASLHESGFV